MMIYEGMLMINYSISDDRDLVDRREIGDEMEVGSGYKMMK